MKPLFIQLTDAEKDTPIMVSVHLITDYRPCERPERKGQSLVTLVGSADFNRTFLVKESYEDITRNLRNHIG